MEYFKNTKELIYLEFALKHDEMTLEKYQKLSEFQVEEKIEINVTRREIEGWKNELKFCERKEGVFKDIIEMLGRTLDGIVQ